jgi:beta-glucosidase
MIMSFKKDFVWGAAAAAYQIEGAWNEDGKDASVWDTLAHQPGAIYENHTGDIACDHYHRYREDVALMAKIGLQAYRLSVAWPRVLPQGTGTANNQGLAFYDRLIDELLAANIEPWVTLFHWDYPQELFLRGGWLHPDSPRWFADYTALVVDQLSDRVSHWITLNEPQCFIPRFHKSGHGAPNTRYEDAEMLQVGHHALLAHGLAVQTIRTRAKKAPQIGWAPVHVTYYPATNSEADQAAANQAMSSMGTKLGLFGDYWNNVWWSDPVVLGHYPEEGLQHYGKNAPKVKADDMSTICQPLDFYGCNIYNGDPVRAGANGEPERVALPAGRPLTAFNWNVTPKALYWGPKFLYDRYKLPVVITENGCSNTDVVSLDGKVHDPQRIDFLHRYLRELRRAAQDGTNILGYFAWSIMDNFEWLAGYQQRFGLIHVDYQTQQRTLKDSALWYREVIATNGENL